MLFAPRRIGVGEQQIVFGQPGRKRTLRFLEYRLFEQCFGSLVVVGEDCAAGLDRVGIGFGHGIAVRRLAHRSQPSAERRFGSRTEIERSR